MTWNEIQRNSAKLFRKQEKKFHVEYQPNYVLDHESQESSEEREEMGMVQ
jgi:hypothetical protein